jgi:hypothetical protein
LDLLPLWDLTFSNRQLRGFVRWRKSLIKLVLNRVVNVADLKVPDGIMIKDHIVD